MESTGRTPVMKQYRVLDMADASGVFCTKIFGALGADVVKIEKPGGDASRATGPFWHDEPDPEKSLHWFTYNLNKKSITLNLESEDGRDLLRRLLKSSDFLVECFPPGYLQKLGLHYEELCKVNPSLIHVSITPFGPGGPYGDFKGSPLVCAAMSGHMFLVGDPDRPPVELSTPAAYIQNGLEAAAAMMVAFWYRQRTGIGQHIDVSVQESFAAQFLPLSTMWKAHGIIPGRSATGPRIEGRPPNVGIFKCSDGYVMCHASYSGGRLALRDWLATEKTVGDLFDSNWDAFFKGSPATVEQKAHIEALFQAFALDKTRAELMFEAQKRGIQCVSEQTVLDVIEDPHLEHRGYFVKVPHPELGEEITYQGAPYKCDSLPWEYRRRAPLIGEHNDEIYHGELGLSAGQLAELTSRGVI
ncbi:MAG: CoA transferase [Chloroflexi bacterium]|nr:CoA transferase [Chloroflexota bacterium]